jgi:hypothetical protein
VEKWISEGIFVPADTPPIGMARGWRKEDVLRLACLVRLVNAGLRIGIGNAIKNLSACEITKSEFLVVLAHKRTIWRSERQTDGTLKPVDTGEHYDAFVTSKEEIKRQLNEPSWESLIHILVNLNDVRLEVDRAWSYAISQGRPFD